MHIHGSHGFGLALVMAVAAGFAAPASADVLDFGLAELAKGGGGNGGNKGKPDPGNGDGGLPTGTYYNWMAPDITEAWNGGMVGQDTTITVVDNFDGQKMLGIMDGKIRRKSHGQWTSFQAGLIAPGATIAEHDYDNNVAVSLSSTDFNVINLSYGDIYNDTLNDPYWAFSGLRTLESSIVDQMNGGAFIAKAAGNDAVAIGDTFTMDIGNGDQSGFYDAFNNALVGGSSVIFVGALTGNGSGQLASYSNFAGSDTTVQNQFLVVGVDSNATALAGTSFAAPIVAGYGAIVSNKFTKDGVTPTADAVASRLLDTAIDLGSPELFGQGEASISAAVAPHGVK